MDGINVRRIKNRLNWQSRKSNMNYSINLIMRINLYNYGFRKINDQMFHIDK